MIEIKQYDRKEKIYLQEERSIFVEHLNMNNASAVFYGHREKKLNLNLG